MSVRCTTASLYGAKIEECDHRGRHHGLEHSQAWQQDVLVSLASGHSYTGEQFEALVDDILAGNRPRRANGPKASRLNPMLFDRYHFGPWPEDVRRDALISGQTLKFGSTGLTIVYGDNASGKSGYARLIKAMVDARHSSDVLPDVFDEGAPQPTAVLQYSIAEAELQHTFPISSGRVADAAVASTTSTAATSTFTEDRPSRIDPRRCRCSMS